MSLETMQVKAGETVNRTCTVKTADKTVQLFNVSKNDKTGQNYKVDWTFDFTDCSEREILELASRSAVIAYRKNFRNVSESDIPEYAELTIDVQKEICTHRKTTKSPVDKVKSLLKGMTEEEIAETLKELGIE